MYDISSGYTKSRAIHVAASLDLSNHLGKDEVKSVFDIAKELNVDPQTLYRLMRCLSQIKMFHEIEEGEGNPLLKDRKFEHGLFVHTPLSLSLCESGPRDMVLFRCGFAQQRCWETLLNSVKTGVSDPSNSLGYPNIWDYLDANKDEADIFNRAMTTLSSRITPGLVESTDFSNAKTICDIGGGQGIFMKNILKANPNIKQGLNFDLKYVISRNKHEANLDPRFKDVDGDFFTSVPEADTYVLKSILHDWNDEKTIKILQVIAKSMPENGRIINFDQVINVNVKNEKNSVVWMDIQAEWHQVAKEAGLKIVAIKRSDLPWIQSTIIFSK
eukprot:gene6745-7840_t